jgi:hypothetical protein
MNMSTIEFDGETVVMDRRYRRSVSATEALAYQCSHIRDGLSLDALVVSDDVGDRWVGAGDRSLCRMLSKAAPELVLAGSAGAEFRLKALQSLRSDLTNSQITTCALRVPGRERHIYVAGVGLNKLRTSGVVDAATGARRILGFDPVATPDDKASAERQLQSIVERSFEKVTSAGVIVGTPPERRFGRFDDTAYRAIVRHIVAPAWETMARSGVVARDPWRSYNWLNREEHRGEGLYVRQLVSPLREARTGVRLGDLRLAVPHRHNIFDLPSAPRVTIRWK